AVPDPDHRAGDRQEASVGADGEGADRAPVGHALLDFSAGEGADLHLAAGPEGNPLALGAPGGSGRRLLAVGPGERLLPIEVPDEALGTRAYDQQVPAARVIGELQMPALGAECVLATEIPQR